MSPNLSWLVLLSIIVLFLIILFQTRKSGQWRVFAAEATALLTFAAFLHVLFNFPTPSNVIAKGASEDLLAAAVLYIFMLLGMLCQYIYSYLVVPSESRPKWDWSAFIAPVFASPIVFIPLFSAFQQSGNDFKATVAPRLMVYLVAFQNGFFWTKFFEQKKKGMNKRQ